jgi:palmitoyltransferase ZDHHC4
LFPYDNILFIPGIHCRTCNITKPARSKHCNVCNACVARHDHHCTFVFIPSNLGVWLGNCIGYSNTHLFLLFLLVNSLLLAYSSYLHYLIFSHEVARIRLFQQRTIESLGPALHSVQLRSTYQLYSSVILGAEMSGALFLICAMICAVTTGFMLHHCWLLSTGTTTNESFKWADLKDAMAAGEIVILDQDDPYMYPLPLRH